MNDLDLPDNSPEGLKEPGRREFRAYYESATDTDAMFMDVLIQMHASLRVGMNELRPLVGAVPSPARELSEKLINDIEQCYTTAREAVRGCITYRALGVGDRKRIEDVLFDPFGPTE